MRGSISRIAVTASALVALAAPAIPAAASTQVTAKTRGPVVSFRLTPPNTATSPDGGMMAAPGDRIRISGGGIFDPATRAVHAGGRFTHYTADGTVHCAGTWKATELTGWTDFGGRRQGRHGGVVSLRVTHYCSTMGEVHTDIPMTVTSTLHAPSGSAYTAGTTVADFTMPTGGRVVIRTG